MSPEAIADGIFTSQSDVFSYGVVLWEIVTYANQPYQGMSNEQALNYILEGRTMRRPRENCSDKIYSIMQNCWKYKPEDRITFTEIVELLLDEAPEKFYENSFHCLKD